MAVLNKADFMKLIKSRVGDDTSDEALKFIEDINDTYDDLEKKVNPNKKTDEEWQKELEAKDNEWREKYKARFFDGVETGENPEEKMVNPEKKEPSHEETVAIDDLFSENGGK